MSAEYDSTDAGETIATEDGGALGSPEYASDQVTSSEACPLSPSVPSSMPNTSPCYPFTRAQAPSSSNYDVTSSGVNDQGNSYETRDYPDIAGSNDAYHYDNKDGSSYDAYHDGSNNFTTTSGSERYTSADGQATWSSGQQTQ
ncbi:hypothetical protein EMMF5_003914 [Cystobasidiomycetes sp. EMM_F5]